MVEILSVLSEEDKKKAMNILKIYDKVYIYIEDGVYHITTNIFIKSSYSSDHKFLGEIKVDEVYSLEERTENYIESFHDYPIWYKGKRNYPELNKRFEIK